MANRLRAKLREAVAKADTIMRAAEAENRVMTDAERNQVDEHLHEARAAKRQLEEARSETEFRAMLKDLAPPMLDTTTSEPKAWLPTWPEYRAALDSSPGGAGVLIPTAQSAFYVEALRPRSVLLSAGPRLLPVDTGKIRIPRVTSSATAAWTAENTPIAESAPATDAVELAPKKLAGLVVSSNELLSDSAPVEARQLVQDDLLGVMGTTLDTAFFRGDPVANPQSPRGLFNVAGVGSVAGAISLATIANAIATIEAANAVPSAIFLSPPGWSSLRTATDADGRYLLEPSPAQAARPLIFNLPVFVSSTVGAGSAGVVADMQAIAVARAADVLISFDSGGEFFRADQTAIRAISRYDLGVLLPAAVVLLPGV